MRTKDSDKMLPTAEAAEYLGIKKSYLRKLMMWHVIPYYKPHGKLCFFDVEDLDKWKRGIRIPSQAEIEQQAQKYLVTGQTPRL